MAYPVPHLKFVGENVIRVYHPAPIEPFTYLTASVAAAGTTLTVKNTNGFTNSDPQDLLLFERLGNENAEIKRINASVSAGTSLTCTAVDLAHPIDTPISKILFDQIEIRGGTTAATAASGSGTIVQFSGSNTSPINVSGPYTDFVVTGTTYAFYAARFQNSLSTTTYYSGYSDGVASTDFTFKNVGFIIRTALDNLNEKISDKISLAWLYDQVYLGELDIAKRLKRWSWLIEPDYDMGNLTTGDRSMSLPSDIEDNQTNKSILGLRIGNGENLWYMDRAEFEDSQSGVSFTTMSSTAAVGATTLVLTNSRDFADSGSVNIAGTLYAYTGNTRATNTLTGLTALAAEITSGTNVWKEVTFSEPLRYTVVDGTVVWECPIDSTLTGRNVWLDYYKTPVRVNSDSDDVTVNDSDAVRLYIERAIQNKKMNGALPADHISNILYEQRVKLLIQNELTGQKIRITPQTIERDFNRSSRRRF